LRAALFSLDKFLLSKPLPMWYPLLALVWLLAKGEDIIPIPGTKRMEYLVENLRALDLSLSETDLSRIDAIVEANPIRGARLP
jgi:aryl-alcohol dehydrogenase-like predicted oxidoreductase